MPGSISRGHQLDLLGGVGPGDGLASASAELQGVIVRPGKDGPVAIPNRSIIAVQMERRGLPGLREGKTIGCNYWFDLIPRPAICRRDADLRGPRDIPRRLSSLR
jgi:hypothetical protein